MCHFIVVVGFTILSVKEKWQNERLNNNIHEIQICFFIFQRLFVAHSLYKDIWILFTFTFILWMLHLLCAAQVAKEFFIGNFTMATVNVIKYFILTPLNTIFVDVTYSVFFFKKWALFGKLCPFSSENFSNLFSYDLQEEKNSHELPLFWCWFQLDCVLQTDETFPFFCLLHKHRIYSQIS